MRIMSDLVVGESDLRDADENVSKHTCRCPGAGEGDGQPFDFKTLSSRNDLPEAFNVNDDLTVGSVINTVYNRLDVPAENFRQSGDECELS